MNDDIGIHVTAPSSEDASMIAVLIGEKLNSAGFNNVDVQSSILSSESGSMLDIIREVNPTLFDTGVSVTYGGIDEGID